MIARRALILLAAAGLLLLAGAVSPDARAAPPVGDDPLAIINAIYVRAAKGKGDGEGGGGRSRGLRGRPAGSPSRAGAQPPQGGRAGRCVWIAGAPRAKGRSTISGAGGRASGGRSGFFWRFGKKTGGPAQARRS